MSAPNPNTVYMMNNLVISLDILQEVTDLTKANKEYAIGKPDAIRPIDLAYGLAQTETTDPNKIDKIFTFGKGLEISNTETLPQLITTPAIVNNEISLSIFPSDPTTDVIQRQQISGEYEVLSNCYAFGKVFLESYEDGGYTYNSISASTLKGSNGFTRIISKDITIDEAKLMFIRNSFDAVEPLSDASLGAYDSYKYIDIYDFILDIDYYDGTYQNSRVYLHTIDNRKIRGFFSFSLEQIAIFLTPQLIKNETNITKRYNKLRTEIINIINEWIRLTNWSPNFISYWQSNSSMMPARLKEFLKTEMGIII
jgi:hypothetical protein